MLSLSEGIVRSCPDSYRDFCYFFNKKKVREISFSKITARDVILLKE